MIVEANPDVKKLADLLEYSHAGSSDTDFGIPACASKISGAIPTQVIGGTHDRIAGLEATKHLAESIVGSQFAEVDAGHLVPFEKPVEWRKLLMDFMAPSSSSP